MVTWHSSCFLEGLSYRTSDAHYSHHMHPKIPSGTVLNLSQPNLLGTIKKLTLKVDYDKCKLEPAIKLNFCHFFDLVTKLDGRFWPTKRTMYPNFFCCIVRGLPGLHNGHNQKVPPDLPRSWKSSFLKFSGQKIEVRAKKWIGWLGCLTDIEMIGN